MRNERRMSGSERGDEKPAAARQYGAHRLLYVSAFLPSVWSAAVSSGRRRKVAPCGSVVHSFRCFLKGSTGEELRGHGRQKSRCNDYVDSPVFMRLLWMHSRCIDGILRPWIALRCRIWIRWIAMHC